MYTKKLSFSKKSRLTSTKEYTSSIKNSHKIITKEIITFIKKNNSNFPRLGIIISKKHIKHACKRNQIKRLIRESFRIHQHFLKKMDFIITIQTKIIILNKESIKQTLHNIWRYKYDANFENTNNINISISNNYQPFTK